MLAAGATMACLSQAQAQDETLRHALCRLVDGAARAHAIPEPFLTRLIWRESSFRLSVTSPAGAQGVAQFMPGTARERGVQDPFDPEQAIPKAAELLAALRRRFGNLGLAAAAYNGGPARVSAWLAGRGGLPAETRAYVMAITGRSAEDWSEGRAAAKSEADMEAGPDAPEGCIATLASLRRPGRGGEIEEALAPWGVQLAGNFSKQIALQSFQRMRQLYAAALGDVRPMIIGTRLRSRGVRAFYRVRLPAQTRPAAEAICQRLQSAGGSCVVLRT